MGMFDTIEADGKCWSCNGIIPSWQTKQLYCLMDVYRQGDRIPLHPNHKHLVIYSYCKGKKGLITDEFNADERSNSILTDGCGKQIDAICILDENLILQEIEVLDPTSERMKYVK